MSGASVIIDGSVLLDEDFNAYQVDRSTGNPSKDTRTVHTIGSASPETRKQGDFKLGYEWNEAVLELGGGISLEDDYESRWGNADVLHRISTRNDAPRISGSSYTDSDIAAILNPDASSYFDSSAYDNKIDVVPVPDSASVRTLRDDRHDSSCD